VENRSDAKNNVKQPVRSSEIGKIKFAFMHAYRDLPYW
jgi:hypothetical protein